MVYQVLTRPILTERSRKLELQSVYTFEVHPGATKGDIKEAFETLYGQTPKSVRILHNHEKVRFGKKAKMLKRPRIKKAYIKLEKPITNFAKITSK